MAAKKSKIDTAREQVQAFDASQQKATDKATDVCGCNASNVPHQHLDRGIVDVQPEKKK